MDDMTENDEESTSAEEEIKEKDVNKILQHVKQVIQTSKINSNDVLTPNKTFNNTDHNHYFKEEDSNCEILQNEKEMNFSDIPEFSITELLVIVQEYEILKDKYDKLQKDVENSLNNKLKGNVVHENVNNNDSNLVEEINSLKLENDRLTQQLEELNSKRNEEKELANAFQKTIERLEKQVSEEKAASKQAVEKLTAHDAAAKRAITVLQKEMGTRIEQVTKMYEESVGEKDAYIIKISKLEQLLEELQNNKSNQNKKISENQSEVESLRSVLKSKDSDYVKLVAENETLVKDISKLNKKIETHKDDTEAQDMKVKWAQNKLKIETDAHKETKKQLSQISLKLQQAKEEGDEIRRNCQEMIERYQGDEEIKSIRLNKELEEQTTFLKNKENEIAKQNETYKQKEKELEKALLEVTKLSEELVDQKATVVLLETENTNLLKNISEKDKDCADYKTNLDLLKEKVKEVADIREKLVECEEEIVKLKEQNKSLEEQVADYEVEVTERKDKQQEILLYSQNLTESNVSSKAMATDLQFKVDALLAEKSELSEKLKANENNYQVKVDRLDVEKSEMQHKIESLLDQIDQKAKTVNELSASLEEAQDELKVIRKKNTSQMKDLQRQLHQTTRKIEQLESGSRNGSSENLSIRSRTSSNNSLEKVHHADSPPNSSSPQMIHDPVLADLSQHGGIMASVYSARPTDKGMTLELSLDINRKLQAVLEDTILKNIMLKENINTLGSEIARLQKEVRQAKGS
ncbi:coiled-coil domain-containing protein 186-like isoform X2 [Hydractinia symbiolongicarpus]|uniref:coiled-coil domain-containing protein 186-like isoform X2 n=1 Tax=Hydractinia symbiolongicarpus TaxID=13093 RepID=UPI00254BDFAB|nr:coiled-coil domain-containing protein 186-like isoform X2 [Hydractinia symbiolongicarpus]